MRAFELSATDYLLKPVVHARLEQALARARARLDARESDSRVAELQDVVAQLRKARHAPAEARYVTEFWVAERDARVRIPVQKVERIEAYGDYVRLFVGERERLLRATLGELEERLDPACSSASIARRSCASDQITALRRNGDRPRPRRPRRRQRASRQPRPAPRPAPETRANEGDVPFSDARRK